VNGERIETLLGQIRQTAEPATVSRVEELVERLLEVYGGGLARILALVAEAGAMTAPLEGALASDPAVSALLTLHGLHPHDARTRVEAALARVRPYLGTHAGGVTLVGIDERGVAHVRLEGTCDGCASSASTLNDLVRRAVEEAAPEIAGVEVDNARAPTHPAPLVQLGRRAS
jgi:Fe-S cluster biogenesis protein NfuA